MTVVVKVAFSDINYGAFAVGDVIELPSDVDWLKAGFVKEVKGEEAADAKPLTSVKKGKRAR